MTKTKRVTFTYIPELLMLADQLKAAQEEENKSREANKLALFKMNEAQEELDGFIEDHFPELTRISRFDAVNLIRRITQRDSNA